jgi:type VI secretion system protein ImpA
MPLPEELLTPIAGDEPAGPDLSTTNAYDQIDRAYREADELPSLSPTGAASEPETGFGEVVELATDYLATQSKDLKVATLLTAALLRDEGFSGLASGLELLRGLMEEYWDGLHPGVAGRVAVLNWLGSDDVAYAVLLTPFTESGHHYYHYKDWAKQEREETAGKSDVEALADADELSASNFSGAFAETPWTWYNDFCSSIDRSLSALDALDSYGRDNFKDTGEKPPPPPSELPTEESAGEPTPGSEASGQSAGQTIQVAEPRDPAEAATAVAAAARVLRRSDPCNPAPYLILRGFRWGELRSAGEHLDPRVLVAPTTVQRTSLKSLFLDQDWENLLEAVEEVMATPAGRGWLDLQRYAVLATERLGGEYRHVAGALTSALRSLITDLPDLLRATLMDDSATASPDTVRWLEAQELIAGDGGGGSSDLDGAADTDAGRTVRQASFDRAAALARAGDPHGAIEMLMDRAEHEGSERARFITQVEAAGIMIDHGMMPIARPILDELAQLIDRHMLEEWEPTEIVAKPLGLLFRCLGSTDGALRQQLYDRLAKLDPLLAMRVSATGQSGPAQQTAEPEPAGQQEDVGVENANG